MDFKKIRNKSLKKDRKQIKQIMLINVEQTESMGKTEFVSTDAFLLLHNGLKFLLFKKNIHGFVFFWIWYWNLFVSFGSLIQNQNTYMITVCARWITLKRKIRVKIEATMWLTCCAYQTHTLSTCFNKIS